jgi:hypothetical protein
MLQPSPVDSGTPDNWAMDVVCTFPLSTHCTLLGIKGTKGRLNNILKDDLSLARHEHLAGWINAKSGFNANWIYASSQDLRFLSLSKTRNLIQITDFIAETQAFAATNYEYLPPIQTPSPPK